VVFFEEKGAKIYMGNRKLAYMIFVTMECNFRCSYCYEGIDKETWSMNIDIADKVIAFILTNSDFDKADEIEIAFHGGEPLLNFDIIKYIILKLNKSVIRWDLLLLIIIMQPIANIVQKKMRKKNEKISNYNRENLSELFSAIKEYTTNLSDIITLGIGNYIHNKFNAILQRQKKSETHICVNSTINESILDLFFLLPVCIILIAGGIEINNNALTIGGLLLFIQYSGQLYEPFTMIYEALYSYSSVLPSI